MSKDTAGTDAQSTTNS